MIVTALRIIEREERADRDFVQRQKSSGFMPPGGQLCAVWTVPVLQVPAKVAG